MKHSRRKRIVRMTAVAVAALSMPAVPSCGGEGETSPTARAVVASALAAFERGDSRGLCDSLSEQGKEVIGLAMHASAPFECERDVRPFLRLMGRYRGEVTVMRTERSEPERAVASLRLPDGTLVTIGLSREDDYWRLDGLFDASISRVQLRGTPRERSKELDRQPASVVTAGVTVRDPARAGGPRCPPTGVARFPELTGGCLIEVQPESVRLSLRTAFGAMRFAECLVSYDVRVDGDGRAWVENVAIGGRNPCFDALACWDHDRQKVPWRGRVERDGRGGFRLRVEDACIDTCVGRFQGGWDVTMVESARTWRLRSASMLGTSGWSIDGGVSSDGKPIKIE